MRTVPAFSVLLLAALLLIPEGCRKAGPDPEDPVVTPSDPDDNPSEPSGPAAVPDGAVDIGLSVYWADRDLGADGTGGYGEYFAWGETTAKDEFSWSNYRFGTATALTGYNTDPSHGTVDGRPVLDAGDDPAHVRLGGRWRMPTRVELEELLAGCEWTWTTRDNVKGYLVTGKKAGYTDRILFLPASGAVYPGSNCFPGVFGDYWTASLSPADPSNASFLYFHADGCSIGNYPRSRGLTIRPVYDPD